MDTGIRSHYATQLGFVVALYFWRKFCHIAIWQELHRYRAGQRRRKRCVNVQDNYLFISALLRRSADYWFLHGVPGLHVGGGLSSDILYEVVNTYIVDYPILTHLFLVAVPEVLRFLTDYRLIIYGLLFVLVMIFKPQGLFGYKEMHFGFVVRWLNRLFKRDKRDQREEGLDDER